MSHALDALNAAAAAEFTAALGAVFEDAPWVAEQAVAARPFATVAALHEAMLAVVRAAPPGRIVAFLRGHPELGGAAAAAGTIGAASMAEQSALGLQRPEDDSFAALNRAYSDRFGFPFILCVRRHTRASLLAEFKRRLDNDLPAERDAALREIGFITRLRLTDQVVGPGMPAVHGVLTTHVLDTAAGRPRASPWNCWKSGTEARPWPAASQTRTAGRRRRCCPARRCASECTSCVSGSARISPGRRLGGRRSSTSSLSGSASPSRKRIATSRCSSAPAPTRPTAEADGRHQRPTAHSIWPCGSSVGMNTMLSADSPNGSSFTGR